MDRTVVQQMLTAYADPEFAAARIEPLMNAGGFSGAQLWRLTTDDQSSYCLRRWPAEHPNRTRLTMIHRVLFHVGQKGFQKLPLPILARSGESFLTEPNQRSNADRFWELAPWIAGQADFHRTANGSPERQARLQNAVSTLAQFHRAAEDFVDSAANRERVTTGTAGVERRIEQLQLFVARECERILAHVQRPPTPHSLRFELQPTAQRFLRSAHRFTPRVLPALDTIRQLRLPQQPCLRDVWHDHVLFRGQEVTGLIDFGALDYDHVAVDLARLLGSLVGDNVAEWMTGLHAYDRIRPLTNVERFLIAAIDAANIVLSGVNWCRWLFVDEIDFGAKNSEASPIVARLQALLIRLEQRLDAAPLLPISYSIDPPLDHILL